jgi:hypothetical protein
MTAEGLLVHFAELLQQFHSPALVGDEANRAQPISANLAAPEAAASSSTPWTGAPGKEETNLLYKMPPDVVAKMNWVIDNVPRMNKQRIVREAVGAYLDGLIEKHYKPN